MSPNKVPSKTPVPVSEDQGALLDVTFEGNNTAHPEDYTTTAHLTETPDGSFQEPPIPAPEPSAAELERRRQAEITKRRHSAQLGKHSVREATGGYEEIKPGDYLPEFGPVTYSNLTRAEEHAERLEAQRKAGKR